MPNCSSGSYFMPLWCGAASNKGSGCGQHFVQCAPALRTGRADHARSNLRPTAIGLCFNPKSRAGRFERCQTYPGLRRITLATPSLPRTPLPVKLRSVEERSKVQLLRRFVAERPKAEPEQVRA
jgi:hypothetical protein